jgi:uncharacterized NAD(P)/FAD-binding protein YdhS
MNSTLGYQGRVMTSTLFTDVTDEISKFDEVSIDFVETTPLPQSYQLQEKFRTVIANLEQQDIGWIDILRAMANIAEQQGNEPLVEVPKSLARQLKRHRKIIRDL